MSSLPNENKFEWVNLQSNNWCNSLLLEEFNDKIKRYLSTIKATKIYLLLTIGEILERRKRLIVILRFDFRRRDTCERIRIGRRAVKTFGSAAAQSGQPSAGSARIILLFQLQQLQTSTQLIDQFLDGPLIIVGGWEEALDSGALF